jgi:hypothetical protein
VEQQSVHPAEGASAAERPARLEGRGFGGEWRAGMPFLKRAGPLAAWVVAGACGWSLLPHMDLLEAVLRSGAVWLAVLALWLGGVSLIERLLDQAAAETSTVEAEN